MEALEKTILGAVYIPADWKDNPETRAAVLAETEGCLYCQDLTDDPDSLRPASLTGSGHQPATIDPAPGKGMAGMLVLPGVSKSAIKSKTPICLVKSATPQKTPVKAKSI